MILSKWYLHAKFADTQVSGGCLVLMKVYQGSGLVKEAVDTSCIWLQVQIAEAECIPVDDMAIYNQGTPLSDDLVVSGNIAELSTLSVEARMLGGK